MNDPVIELRIVVAQLAKSVESLNKFTDSLATKEAVVNIERRVAALESIVTWLGRIVVGAVILALIALVIKNGGTG